MNKKKIEGTLKSLGVADIDEVMKQVDVLSEFSDYMKEKYNLETDDEVDKMMDVFMNSKSLEMDSKLESVLSIVDDEDEMFKIMLDELHKLTPEYMVEYAKLHEYDKIDEFKIASEKYIKMTINENMLRGL